MTDRQKITEGHRRRRAVVYVRQSTPTQLERNHESRARQYALRQRAVELGWPASGVSLVDEDLGRSGASADGRLGFKELVAEVGLGQVGLVLALEVSRLARSSADWHQLLDLCALTGTLIADQDGIYSPQDFNDRLLLGLKGTMSEAELHLIRARLDGGLRNKAERGELELGRRMQVAYSGNGGRVPRYACQRGRDLHATGTVCQSLGGLRLERAVAEAFLEAVTPAGVRASAEAIGELETQHEERLRAQRLAVERAEFEAGRARRQFDACEPEHRLVARTLEARLEEALADLERERRKLAELEQRRPEPLSAEEREALARVARDLPRLWHAKTTTDRDRKELLRTLVAEAIVTVHQQPRRAEIEIVWEGGARSRLAVPLIRRGPEGKRTDEDTVELIGRLAAHNPDRQIAPILNKQGRRTGTGLPSTKHASRAPGSAPASPPPRRPTPTARS